MKKYILLFIKVLSQFLIYAQVLDVYDCGLGLLRIGPFNYDPLRGVDLWLAQSDQFILQHLSTSPEVEQPHFVSQVMLIYILFLYMILLLIASKEKDKQIQCCACFLCIAK